MNGDYFMDAEVRRRERFLDSELPSIDVPPDSIWGQSEHSVVDRLRQVELPTLMAPYLTAAGLGPAAGPNRGSDPPDLQPMSEPSAGTFLSGSALVSSACSNRHLLTRMRSVIDTLARCQARATAVGASEGYVGRLTFAQFRTAANTRSPLAPRRVWFDIAFTMVGLLDAARYCGDEKAADCATKLGYWIEHLPETDPDLHASLMGIEQSRQISSRYDWRHAMATALAYLAMVTTSPDDPKSGAYLLDSRIQADQGAGDMPFPDNIAPRIDDALDGAARFILGDPAGFNLAEEIWTELAAVHIGPAGGVCAADNPLGERDSAADGGKGADGGTLGEGGTAADGGADCCVGCATHRMIELAAVLLSCELDARYADYLGLATVNHVATVSPPLPQQGVGIEIPFGPAVRMDRHWPTDSCCEVNTSLARLRLRQSIFTLHEDEVAINLFIPATLEVPGSGWVHMGQITGNRFRIEFGGEPPGKLQIRWPDFATEMWLHGMNGPIPVKVDKSGYVTVPGVHHEGTSIEVETEWDISVIRSSRDPARFSIRYGPWVLAALSADPAWLEWSPNRISEAVREVGPDGPWQIDSIPLVPLLVVGNGPFHSAFWDPDY